MDVEKGHLVHDEKSAMANRREPGTPNPESVNPVSGEFGGEDKTQNAFDDADAPLDGDQTVQEWQEGRKTVIERRTGPGEDVSRTSLSSGYTAN